MQTRNRLSAFALLSNFCVALIAYAGNPNDDSQSKPKFDPSHIQQVVVAKGLHLEKKWAKSAKKQMLMGKTSFSEGPIMWLGEYRAYNGSIGKGLSTHQAFKHDLTGTGLNEVTVTTAGFDDRSVFKVRITAEIFKPEYRNHTFELTAAIIDEALPGCPDHVKKAFASGQKVSDGPWRVSTGKHEAGFDASLIYCTVPDDYEFWILNRAASE